MTAEDKLVRPGDIILVELSIDPAKTEDHEPCHPDIVLDDFIQSPKWEGWQLRIRGVELDKLNIRIQELTAALEERLNADVLKD
jgi:hypothetical protein